MGSSSCFPVEAVIVGCLTWVKLLFAKHCMDVSKIGVPQNGWFIMENPIKMDDLAVPLFLETSVHYKNIV